MTRNFQVYLEEIIESIDRIKEYIKHCSGIDDFQKNIEIQDAVMHRLAIIGEAVKRLPKAIRDENPQVPWKDISGTRDILIHDYNNVNFNKVWDIVTNDLEPLEKEIKLIVSKTRQF